METGESEVAASAPIPTTPTGSKAVGTGPRETLQASVDKAIARKGSRSRKETPAGPASVHAQRRRSPCRRSPRRTGRSAGKEGTPAALRSVPASGKKSPKTGHASGKEPDANLPDVTEETDEIQEEADPVPAGKPIVAESEAPSSATTVTNPVRPES